MQNFNAEDYITVAERIGQFRADNPDGKLLTSIVEHSAKKGFIVMKCDAYRKVDDAGPSSTGHAFEYRDDGEVNWTSYIENCETSCVGRALALLGYGVKGGIASREEMLKVQRHSQTDDRRPTTGNYFPPIARQPEPERDWQAKNGKAILVLKDGEREPDQVPCPIHPGKTLKRRENNNGSWLSHKDGQADDGREVYCSASFGRAPRPQAQADDLRAQLADHNRNGRTAN